MAEGIQKNTTIIGLAEEAVEGVYEAPTEFVQPLEDGFDLTPSKELVERTILDSSIGVSTPRVGLKSVAASLPCEFRASGIEGGTPDFDLLLKGALGDVRSIVDQTTTKAGNAVDQLEIEDADIGDFAVGDIFVILESGDHSIHAVESVDPSGGSANIGYVPARTGAPADNVVLSKSRTYFPANSGHPPISLSYYWANEILEKAIGTKVTSLSVDGFETGGIASFNFALEGLSFDEIDGSTTATGLDTGLPPLILNACVFQDDNQLNVNQLTVSIENTLGFITSTCDVNGRISSRVTNRAVVGSFNPYKDDTSVAQFTKFETNTPYSVFAYAANPSGVDGEFELGSVVGIYMPNAITVEKVVGDQEGILVDNINFQATRGESGGLDEIFIGLV